MEKGSRGLRAALCVGSGGSLTSGDGEREAVLGSPPPAASMWVGE